MAQYGKAMIFYEYINKQHHEVQAQEVGAKG
jgi:hypothetical protein